MNKLWYIQDNKDQFGPYSELDLQQFFRENKINSETMLIRSGQSEPIFVRDLIKNKRGYTKVSSSEIKEFPYQKEKTNIARSIDDTVLKKEKSKAINIKSIIVTLICLSIPLILIYKYRNNPFSLKRPNQVSLKSFKNTKKEILDAYQNKKATYKFLMSKDFKRMWLTSSLPNYQSIEVHFKSLKDKVISNSPIEFTTKVNLEGDIQELSTMKFISGDDILPGIYKVTIIPETKPLSFILPKIKVKKSYESFLLLKAKNKKSFQKRLKGFKQRKQKIKGKNQDLSMKYLTIKSIIDNTKNELENILKAKLKKVDAKNKMESFKSLYQKKYGIFFTSFVSSNHEELKKLSAIKLEDLKKAGHLNIINKLSKRFGMLAVEAINQIQNVYKDDRKLKSIVDELSDLSATCQSKIENL